MNRRSSPVRRLAAGLAGAAIAVTLLLAPAAPASASDAPLQGECGWDADAGEWLISWTLDPVPPAGATGYRITETAVTPEDTTLKKIEPTPHDGYPHPAEAQVGTQQVLPDASTASLSVGVEWDNGTAENLQGQLTIPDDCALPEVPVTLGQWSFDCDSLTITIDNPTPEAVGLSFQPSTGDSVDVEVAGGQSATVAFPASAGLTVDVLYQGHSIVDPDQPIEITAAGWAELTCDDGGEAGDLPATGVPIGLVIGGAALLLALGAGLFLLARRRRITFTA